MRDAKEAQTDANHGELVVVVYESPDPHKAGHVAIVRPSEKSSERLEESGPQIIQAGQLNYTSTTVKIGFQHMGNLHVPLKAFVQTLGVEVAQGPKPTRRTLEIGALHAP